MRPSDEESGSMGYTGDMGEDDRLMPGDRDPMTASSDVPYGRSALTLWLWLAGVGVMFCTVVAVLLFLWFPELSWVAWVLAILAVIAAADLCWLAQRKGRGETS